MSTLGVVTPPLYFGCLAIVKEVGTDQTNLWIGPIVTGPVGHFDAVLYSEEPWIWESGYVTGAGDFASRMVRVGAVDLWTRGAGNPTLMAFSLDRKTNVTSPLMTNIGIPSALSTEPGMVYSTRFDLDRVDNYTIRVSGDSTSWAEISGFVAYSKQSAFNR